MRKVKATDFRKYAGRSQERWNLLVGRAIEHQACGQGVISEITVRDGEVSIWIGFPQAGGEEQRRCFGPQAMNMMGEIELPDAIARQVLTTIPAEPFPSPTTRPTTESQKLVGVKTVQNPPQKFSPNQEVCLKKDASQRGRIVRARVFAKGEWNYEIYFSADDIRTYRESDLKAYIPTVQWGGLEDLLRDLALVKLRKPLGDALYALYASRTKFEVYQFKPAVKFLSNPDQRLLIADEVGLGKTIEAGIIYLELQARIGLDRVLVVCPSSLRHKWQDELKSRFDEEFTILDMQGVRRFLEQYTRFGAQTRLRGIVSLELIRRREIAEALTDVKLDLLIIDEAHHCRNTATLANAVASTLTENSDAALMLTATPLQMGREDLFNLLNILSPGEFDNFQVFSDRLEPNQFVNRAAQMLSTGKTKDALKELQKVERTTEKQRFIGSPYYQTVVRILEGAYPTQQELITAQRRLLELNTLASVFTRTRKRDIQEKVPKRTAFVLSVHFTPEEKRFYDHVVDEVRYEFMRNHGSGAGSGWITIMKERQAASCISAVLKRQAQEKQEIFPEDEAFESDFIRNDDLDLTGDNDHDLTEDEAAERLLRSIFSEGQYNSPSFLGPRPKPIPKLNFQKDSKFEVFWSSLQKVLADDPKRKILVFSFFVGTIEYVKSELSKRGVNVRAIHGSYKVIDRQKIIEDFHDDPSIRVLVSSDVGSEGLDFQFCDTIFNYDLPWNPMKVEQRIGRIDRFGQESDRISIYNLVIEDTIESRIMMRLYDRIEIFKQSIGDIEVILGDQIRELTQAVFSNRLSPQEEIKRAEQAANNIMRQKQEMEEFEQKKLQFLGQEAIFSTTITHTIESGRFVSDVETHALVEGFLKEKYPLSRLQSNGKEDATYTLFANDDLVEGIKAFIFKQHKNDLSAQQFLHKLMPGKEIPLTFSHELAYQRKLLEFVTPRHPLVQAAQENWRQKSQEKMRLARFKLKSNTAPSGNYYFFVFSIDSDGIDKESRLIPVVVQVESGDVNNQLSKQFLRLIQTNSMPVENLWGQCDENELKTMEDTAMLYMTITRDDLDRELSMSNESLLNARLTAVENSYQAKRKRIESIQKKVNNASINRMYEAQLRNLAAKKKAKVKEIEQGRNVNVSFSLQLRGCVEVVNNA